MKVGLQSEIPERLQTPRLVLRVPQAGDGATLWTSVQESLVAMQPWLSWATPDYTQSDAEQWCSQCIVTFREHESLPYFLFLPDGRHIGACGTEPIDWKTPAIGFWYWLRTGFTGNGYMVEAVSALTTLVQERIDPARIEIRVDQLNTRSCRVAERCGFTLEGTLRRDFRYPDGRLRDTRVYARVR